MTITPLRLAVFRQDNVITKWLALGVGSLCFLWLMLVHQPFYPAPWFDEGLNVSTAAMLAREGFYALPDSDSPRVMDPAIQTGPTVLVPVAVAFHLFGIGIMPARLVMILFAAIALVTYALIARKLVGNAAMVLAVVFLLVGTREDYTSFVFMSRQVLGEVPALAYTLLGLLIWLRTVEQPERRWTGLIFSGLAWGIAMVTKSQILLLLPVCLGILMLLDIAYYRRTGMLAYIIPGVIMVGCVASWYAAQIAIVGIEQFRQNSEVLREGFALHVVSINPSHWRNALGVIWRTGWWIWGAPALLWGIWQARQRNANGFRHAVMLALPLVGMVWFSGLSVGWGRYAFYSIVLTHMWTAGLLVALWQHIPGLSSSIARRLIIGGLIMLYIGINVVPLARNLIAPQDNGYLAMQTYLNEVVPADAVIETWEWEMSLDTRQPMHHPPTPIANLVTAYIWSKREPVPTGIYDAHQAEPRYILQGAFGAWTGIYDDTLKQEADLVQRFGTYALYELRL